MTYFAVSTLRMDVDRVLFEEPACRIMLMLNAHTAANVGTDKMMTLSDLQELEERKKKNG